MALAKPGMIKGKCQMNALITLKEYLDDFASADVRRAGYRLIDKMKTGLTDSGRRSLEDYFGGIREGRRDEYV
jgi:2-iminoacetate synthase